MCYINTSIWISYCTPTTSSVFIFISIRLQAEGEEIDEEDDDDSLRVCLSTKTKSKYRIEAKLNALFLFRFTQLKLMNEIRKQTEKNEIPRGSIDAREMDSVIRMMDIHQN